MYDGNHDPIHMHHLRGAVTQRASTISQHHHITTTRPLCCTALFYKVIFVSRRSVAQKDASRLAPYHTPTRIAHSRTSSPDH
jgi:hypothetical protein